MCVTVTPLLWSPTAQTEYCLSLRSSFTPDIWSIQQLTPLALSCLFISSCLFSWLLCSYFFIGFSPLISSFFFPFYISFSLSSSSALLSQIISCVHLFLFLVLSFLLLSFTGIGSHLFNSSSFLWYSSSPFIVHLLFLLSFTPCLKYKLYFLFFYLTPLITPLSSAPLLSSLISSHLFIASPFPHRSSPLLSSISSPFLSSPLLSSPLLSSPSSLLSFLSSPLSPLLSSPLLSSPLLSSPLLSSPLSSSPSSLLSFLSPLHLPLSSPLSPLLSSPLLSSPLLSYLILSYLILSYLILSYLILSYLILSYLILSYLILSSPLLSPPLPYRFQRKRMIVHQMSRCRNRILHWLRYMRTNANAMTCEINVIMY